MPMAGAKNSAAPRPKRNLDTSRVGKFGDNPSPIPDKDRMSIPSWDVFLGPHLAETIPAGIWNMPAPRRKDEVRRPWDGRSTFSATAISPVAPSNGAMLNQFIV